MRLSRAAMTRPPAAGALLAGLVAASCGGSVADPRPQWVVSIETDAPVPQMGDRLLVEVLDASGNPACPSCRRLFGVRDAGSWPVSFGLTDEGRPVTRIRARLFRADHVGVDGLPTGSLVLDAVGDLDHATGVSHVRLPLPFDCAGVSADPALGTTCILPGRTKGPAARLSDAGPSLVAGSHPSARAIPCPRPAPSDMLCIAGGAFALGDPKFAGFSRGEEDETVPLPERLVVLSPYFLDEREVTVGTVRSLLASGAVKASLVERGSISQERGACTYTAAPDAFESHPINCITAAEAEQICAALGKRLPTEAEWEFAAANRTSESQFPWGASEDYCAMSVLSRARSVSEGPETSDFLVGSSFCRTQPPSAPTKTWGPVPVTSETLDRSSCDASGRCVSFMGGNVAEWVADGFASYDAPCWQGFPLRDPQCPAQTAKYRVVRGGSWASYGYEARAHWRQVHTAKASPSVGVRCAASP